MQLETTANLSYLYNKIANLRLYSAVQLKMAANLTYLGPYGRESLKSQGMELHNSSPNYWKYTSLETSILGNLTLCF